MDTNESIPEPSDSGGDGRQGVAVKGHSITVSSPLRGLPIARAVEGIASSNARAFGGETASALIAGIAAHLSSELERAREEVGLLRERNALLLDQAADFREKIGRLEEKIAAYLSQQHLKNAGIAIGSFLLTAGLGFLTSGKLGYGVAASTIGIILILIVWLSSVKGASK